MPADSNNEPSKLITAPPAIPKKRRVGLLIACIVAGVVIGGAGAAVGAWAWAKGYLESEKFWTDVSARAGVELTAAKTTVTLIPPRLEIGGIEARREGVRMAAVKQLSVQLDAAGLATFVAALDVDAAGVEVFSPSAGVDVERKRPGQEVRHQPKQQTRPADGAEAGLSSLPVRRFELDLRASDVRLPVPYLPRTDIEFKGALTPAGDRSQVKIELLKMLGLKLSGQADLDAQGTGAFGVELPVKDSLISGRVEGQLDHYVPRKAKADLKLPNTPLPIPSGATWLAGEKVVELKGSANLGGGVTLQLDGTAWNADALWDLDLTNTTIGYGTYEKPAGKVATARGKFIGNADKWKLSETSIALGGASAELDVEAGAGQPTHVAGRLAPFEIAEFVPLLFKPVDRPANKKKGSKTAAIPKISGKASAKLDLILPPQGEPSGKIALDLDSWSLDGTSLMALAGVAPTGDDEAASDAPEVTGALSLKGKVNADIAQGMFKEGTVRLLFDATGAGARYGEYFHKRAGQPLIMDVAGEGSGKSVVIKGLKIQGPGGLRLAAKGNVLDLKDYLVKLQLVEGRLPLDVLGEFIPMAGEATGLVGVRGEVQGSLKDIQGLFTKLSWDLKNVTMQTDSFAVKKLTGNIETVVTMPAKQGDGESLAQGPAYLVRFPGLSGQFTPPAPNVGDEVPTLALTAQGSVTYRARALTGDLTATVSELNVTPYLKPRHEAGAAPPAPKAGAASTAPGAAKVEGPLDLKRSKFRLALSSPKIRTPYLDFTDAQTQLTLGAGAVAGAPDVTIEKISGRALEGDLLLKAKIQLEPSRVELFAGGKNLAMSEVSKLVQKLSGKNLESSIFGRGDLDAAGVIAGGLAGADISGTAVIREGGFKFLPAPKKFLDALRQVPKLGEKLPVEKDTGQVSDKLEKANAKFHLKGDRLDLEVESADAYMAMNAGGFVTLGGHCDMKGTVTPTAKLVSGDLARAAEGGVPFVSQGDSWACGFKPELGKLAAGVAKGRITEELKKAVPEGAAKAIKGLFGN